MKYQILLVDVPWSYRDKHLKHGGAEKHYPTMSTQDICDLPIKDIADDNCFLFLWATFPNLPEALKVINAWGFQYKTIGFNWIKLNKSGSLFWGCGRSTRSNSEICLLATKGKPKVISHSVHSVIMSQREQHSKKPNVVRERIIELCGDLPRIELFGRQTNDGWHVVGNEIDGKDIKEALQEIINEKE